MKKLFLFLFVALMWAVIPACKPQDRIYQEWYNQAYQTNYPQRATNLVGQAGYLCAYLTWDRPVSPTCTEAVVYWNFNSDSTKISLSDPRCIKDNSIFVKIDDLRETDYTFDVYTIDREGSRSLASETLVSPKGPVYVASLSQKLVLDAVISEINEAGVINWGDRSKVSPFSELRYKDASSREVTIEVPSSDKTTILRDINFDDPGAFEYRSVFVTDACADTIYGEWNRVTWFVDTDYSKTIAPGDVRIGFSTRKNGTVTQDSENPDLYVFDCTGSDMSANVDPLTAPLTKPVLVFQYKQTLKSSSVKVYWIDNGGSAATRRYTAIVLTDYISGSDEWSVAKIDMTDYWITHLWEGNVGDKARLDFNTTAGNVITIRNAHFRDRREGE